MSRAHRTLFASVRSEGGLLPSTLLERLSNGDRSLAGTDPGTYHLEPGERINETASRAWMRLLGAWRGFREACAKLPEKEVGTSVTRERWLLPLFQELGYGRLQPIRGAIEIEGRSFPVSHKWGGCPIHLVGFRTELDRKTAGVVGAARSSPHGLVQEYLNKVEESLWGYVTNGLWFRILRDNVSLTRPSFVEFDLEAMMEGEAYSDFVLLWMVTHQSRVEAEKPHDCWLERWSQEAAEQGTRALDRLRNGVEEAIRALGRGFLSHPANHDLRENLRSGALAKEDYYREVLRLVYRLLFLFVAEDRGLLLDPYAGDAERDRYLRFYSTGRLRRLAERRRGSPHVDLYRGLRLVMEKLGDTDGCPGLGLPPLGSFLWSPEAIACLASSEITNRDFLEAIRALAFAERERRFWPVDYRNLGAEELGSVYESLLELHPDVDTGAGTFELRSAAGSERKTTGSYYTPSSLIACLLDSAVDPVLAEAARAANSERAILDLKICDPACGSGHFLIAAAHRVAKRLAAVRTGDEEPSPDATRTALRDVIGHCIYGVDLNPMAVELCKVNLWMEALEPGKPLSFLDHRIQCGNSLLGTTPALMAAGIPDEAFTALEGDDKDFARAAKNRNRAENQGRQKAMILPMGAEPGANLHSFARVVHDLDSIGDESIEGVRRKENTYDRLSESVEYRETWRAANAWCGAFVWKKASGELPAVTTDVLRRIESEPSTVPAHVLVEVDRLAEEYRFFQWHLAFPDVFREVIEEGTIGHSQAGWREGFDVVLANPPWVSYTGRQRVEVSDRFLHLLVSRFPCISRWPASHPAFLVLSTELLRGSGRAGLVLPKQVADLAAYGKARAAVAATAHLASPVVDAGEDAFPGVTQPVGLFSIAAGIDPRAQSSAPWVVGAGLATRSTSTEGSRAAGVTTEDLPNFVELLACRPRFAPKTFADPGVHTGNVSKRIILAVPKVEAGSSVPIREGRDITAFVCGLPRKWLWVTPCLAPGEYCTIRDIGRYRAAPILIRQTADRPIAARHHNPTYFRNTLLACFGVPDVPSTIVIAFLNSALYAVLHRTATQDASQKAFPQVKVRHLHALPAIPVESLDRRFEGQTVRIALETAVAQVEGVARVDAPASPQLLERIERLVLSAFDLDPDLACRLVEVTR